MNFAVNPVTARELRERFRAPRSPIFFTLWLLVVMGLGYLIYLLARAVADNQGFFGSSLLASSSIGNFMLEALLFLLLTGVGLIVPGVASLSIVGERERQTLHLLQVSQLSAWQIVLGKLASSLAYLLLLLVAVAPLLVLPVLFGGVTFRDVLAGLAIIGLTAVTLGAVSISFSARAKSGRGAVAASYGASFFLGAGTAILILLEVVFFPASPNGAFGRDGREVYSMWLNPYVALVSAVDEPGGLATGGFGSPFDPIDELLVRRQSGVLRFGGFAADPAIGFAEEEVFIDGDALFNVVVEGPGGVAQFAEPSEAQRGSVWVRTLLVYVLISGLMLWRAARAVRAPPRRRRRQKALTNAAA